MKHIAFCDRNQRSTGHRHPTHGLAPFPIRKHSGPGGYWRLLTERWSIYWLFLVLYVDRCPKKTSDLSPAQWPDSTSLRCNETSLSSHKLRPSESSCGLVAALPWDPTPVGDVSSCNWALKLQHDHVQNWSREHVCQTQIPCSHLLTKILWKGFRTLAQHIKLDVNRSCSVKVTKHWRTFYAHCHLCKSQALMPLRSQKICSVGHVTKRPFLGPGWACIFVVAAFMHTHKPFVFLYKQINLFSY